MSQLIFDFETLGQSTFTAPVVSVAYLVFDWNQFLSDRPYELDQLVSESHYQKFDVEDQVTRFGAKIEQSTLDWWAGQSAVARAALKRTTTDVPYETFVERFLAEVPTDVGYWWSRSNTFDPIFLERIFRQVGRQDDFSRRLKFWNVRDTRTWIDAKIGFSDRIKNAFCPYASQAAWDEVFVKHDPRYDVAADVLRLQKIARAEEGLDQ